MDPELEPVLLGRRALAGCPAPHRRPSLALFHVSAFLEPILVSHLDLKLLMPVMVSMPG